MRYNNHNQIKNNIIRINNNLIRIVRILKISITIIITTIIMMTIIQMIKMMTKIVKMDGIKMVLKKEKENLLFRLEC